MSAELLHAINSTKRPRVVVLGDIILDHYIQGEVDRISPEAPIPVLKISEESYKLGGAANVAANVVSMNAEAVLIGVIGNDRRGKEVSKQIRQSKGLSAELVKVEDRPTIVKTRLVAKHQQMLRVDEEESGEFAKTTYLSLEKALASALKHCDVLVLSDYGKGVLSTSLTKKAIQFAKKAKVPVVVDPKGRDYSKYKGATTLTPNRLEAETATGTSCANDKSVRKALEWLRDNLKLSAALITLGGGGVAVLQGKDQLVRIPTIARSVFDVTGAGDTFIATLAVFLGQGSSIEDAARLANSAAGIKVGKFGAAAITRDELRRAVIAQHEAFDHQAKVVSQRDLKANLGSLRDAGRSIVFTNGCFDILHAGHVTYLNFCKQQGDVLVVALNSDASVRAQEKSPERPINNEEDRARVLAALADVDFVTIFGEKTPLNLIKSLKPDVLVKGEDWKGKGVVGANEVEERGGKVVFAPLLAGRSTTNVVQKLGVKG